MQHLRSSHRIAATFILLALLCGASAGWWFCQKSDAIAFLPVRSGAQWIIDAAPPEIIAQPNAAIKNVFRCRFALSTLPTNATLTICALKSASAFINGRETRGVESKGENWKSPKTADVTGQLHVGTNEITVWVTNNAGPSALWLRLQSENCSLSSDEHWQVSLTGEFWNPSHLASQPVSIPHWSGICDDTSTFTALKKSWRTLALFLAVALGVVLIAKRYSNTQRHSLHLANFNAKLPPIYLLLAVVLVTRTVLFINEASNLPGWFSFDGSAHLAYVKYIEENGKLPQPDSGWETHQPPLYYLISAAAMKLCGCSLSGTNVIIPLCVINGIIGLLHCWLALLCFRLLFPNNFSAQAGGLLLAAFLPPHLYLSAGITNDPLTELCVTAAFYFLLRILQLENAMKKHHFWLYTALGLALGAAMLSKLSALPAVLVFLFVLALHLIQSKNISPRNWLQSVGLVAAICLAVSSWYYLRLSLHTGSLAAIPKSVGNSWWQTPGFRTAGYYFSFGQVFIHPLFSGLDSFADGIYSTLWGDGMASGASEFIFRPPWNYDLMKVSYLLALPLSILALTGIVPAWRKFIRDQRLDWFFVIVIIFIYFMALITLTLLGPWQSQVKAFYAMPAFVPFCALVVLCWERLMKKHSTWKIGLWVLVLVWSLTICASFWIGNGRAETWRSRTVVAIRSQHFQQAVNAATKALSLNPNDFETHCLLAEAFTSQKKPHEAVQEYLAAMQINPDSPKILNMFATMLLGEGKDAAPDAVKYAEHACELTGHRSAEMLTTLALAYGNAGQNFEAVATANVANELAREIGDADLLGKNQELIKRYRTQETSK
jgi:hypothetical protein